MEIKIKDPRKRCHGANRPPCPPPPEPSPFGIWNPGSPVRLHFKDAEVAILEVAQLAERNYLTTPGGALMQLGVSDEGNLCTRNVKVKFTIARNIRSYIAVSSPSGQVHRVMVAESGLLETKSTAAIETMLDLPRDVVLLAPCGEAWQMCVNDDGTLYTRRIAAKPVGVDLRSPSGRRYQLTVTDGGCIDVVKFN